jgi:WD40 repeat protein
LSATELRGLLDSDDSAQGFFDATDSVLSVALSSMHPTLALTGDQNNQAYIWSDSQLRRQANARSAGGLHSSVDELESAEPPFLFLLCSLFRDITKGERRFHLTGHTDSVIDCGFSADGRLAATASMDATVRVYNVADGSLRHSLEGPAKEIEWMQWHPVGPVLVAGSADETLWMWNADSGECMSVFSGQGGSVTAGGWSADGKTLLSCGESGDLIVWNPKTGEAAIHNKGVHEGPVTSFACHPDKTQRLCATGGADGIIKVWNFDSGKMLTQFRGGHTDSVEGVQFAPRLKLLASGSVDGKVKIWDMTNGQCRVTCAHEDAVTHVEWAPNGDPFVFSSSVDKTVRQWDVRSGECVRTWRGHSDAVLAFRISDDAGTLVTASDDHTALVFKR